MAVVYATYYYNRLPNAQGLCPADHFTGSTVALLVIDCVIFMYGDVPYMCWTLSFKLKKITLLAAAILLPGCFCGIQLHAFK